MQQQSSLCIQCLLDALFSDQGVQGKPGTVNSMWGSDWSGDSVFPVIWLVSRRAVGTFWSDPLKLTCSCAGSPCSIGYHGYLPQLNMSQLRDAGNSAQRQPNPLIWLHGPGPSSNRNHICLCLINSMSKNFDVSQCVTGCLWKQWRDLIHFSIQHSHLQPITPTACTMPK